VKEKAVVDDSVIQEFEKKVDAYVQDLERSEGFKCLGDTSGKSSDIRSSHIRSSLSISASDGSPARF
jgi:hypothetical protein